MIKIVEFFKRNYIGALAGGLWTFFNIFIMGGFSIQPSLCKSLLAISLPSFFIMRTLTNLFLDYDVSEILATILILSIPFLWIIFGAYLEKVIKQKSFKKVIIFLAIISIITILFYFLNVMFEPQRMLPAKCTMQAGLACLDHEATAASLAIIVQNSLGFDITVDAVKANQCTALGNQGVLSNSRTATYVLTCVNPGFKYNGAVNITYTVIDTQESRQSIGAVMTRIQGELYKYGTLGRFFGEIYYGLVDVYCVNY